jgi:hypothetical protein
MVQQLKGRVAICRLAAGWSMALAACCGSSKCGICLLGVRYRCRMDLNGVICAYATLLNPIGFQQCKSQEIACLGQVVSWHSLEGNSVLVTSCESRYDRNGFPQYQMISDGNGEGEVRLVKAGSGSTFERPLWNSNEFNMSICNHSERMWKRC